jgi:hypothetical protein
MVIVAIAEPQEDFIVPIPFDLIPSNIQGHEKIIVAIDDIPPSRKLLFEISAFYGSENCEVLSGKLPNSIDEKTVICVSSQCIINKATSQQSKLPPAHISPLWTEDRFGISSEEAMLVDNSSHEMKSSIHCNMAKFRSKLDDLRVNLDLRLIKSIEECHQVIKMASDQLEQTKRDCRWMAAESVARFLRHKFPVQAWPDTMIEPAVLFCVKEEHDDDEAVVLGASIEGVLNEIEPINADRFFNIFVFDASVFPIVMDISFVDGKRVTSQKEYRELMQAEDHNRT